MSSFLRKFLVLSLLSLLTVGVLGGLLSASSAFQSQGSIANPTLNEGPLHFRIEFFTNVAMTHRIGNGRAVEGSAVYLNIFLVNAKGEPVHFPGSDFLQITIQISSGTISATNVYIGSGSSNTGKSFGPIQWFLSASTGIKVIVNSTADYDSYQIFGRGVLHTVA